MDICQLISEQQEEMIEDLLALKDIVPIEESCLPEEEEDLCSAAGNKCIPVTSK